MSDDLAAAIVSAASPAPAEPSPAQPSAPEFSGVTYTFNLREALIDLRFTLPANAEASAFSAVLCVAIADDGRMASAIVKADDDRWFDETVVARKALAAALENIGTK